ncbi:hypothetical protein P171DRAFT_426596 [Karstenula rhodostoma CBS 690.94]|uniref:Rhodopsin domain-containing protein n=1 Tax=Karstenula rhodostoma CBS 690.94 TaxID=1392251 RepID=A0A9P4UH00_9PLEO|nr:hypothetical protein P171DRAFT_426596 [Karstenula rhodostoma CBS 690.94]
MSAQPTADYLNESRQPNLYAASTITYIGALLAVTLRLWARKLKSAKFRMDDWFIIAAQIGATALLINMYWWVSRGYGKHREAVGPTVDYDFFLGFFIAEIIYTVIITFVKYSILALYWRLFQADNILWPIGIMSFVATAWGVAVLLLSILACIPPKAIWDKTIEDAKCGVDMGRFLWGISIPNIISDVVLLLLPVPYVLRLNMSYSQKRLILGTFFLGGFVCIASIMRLVSVIHQDPGPDASWNWTGQGYWAVTECHLAIISACLPTLRPIWTHCVRTPEPSTTEPSFSCSPVWTIGSSGKRTRRFKDDSLLVRTVNSVVHPFSVIDEGRESDGEVVFAPQDGAHTARATVEGYEMDDISKRP